jgi:ribosomal protein S18 acetylase RimI-like enzyme
VATVRRLGRSDDSVAKAACARFEWPDADPEPFLARPEASLFVAEDEDGSVLGWVNGHEHNHPNGERTMLLYALDVVEGARRRGHGRRLVTAFVGDASRRGCTEVWVLTDDQNPAGPRTYASAGGTREPVDQVMFVWPLAGADHESP